MTFLLFFLLLTPSFLNEAQSVLDNGFVGDPKVECMEDRLKLTFKTEKPFKGRIFVKGMIDDKNCVSSYAKNSNSTVDYSIINGSCNMRRNRKLGPNQRGVEQSTVVIVSFHDTFITKGDRAYHCACLYNEIDKIVTNRFDVSMFPTTELFDQAKIPTCTYSVHRDSVNGPVVNYAAVGQLAFHVWTCDSDMFEMLVHNCFVDDGTGKERFRLIDENGCSVDSAIVSDLTYNAQNNMAYAEVNVFKFADKVTTYFQCAVSTCMISEGTCKGKTPPRCGAAARRRRTVQADYNQTELSNKPWDNEMDLSADKIIVLDPEDIAPKQPGSSALLDNRQKLALRQLNEIRNLCSINERVCLTREVITVSTCFLVTFTCFFGLMFLWRAWRKTKL